MRRRSLMIATAAALALSACSTVQRSSRPTLQPNAVWAVAPFVNHTETPMAGRRAQSIVTEWLAASVSPSVVTPPVEWLDESLFEKGQLRSTPELLQWAQSAGARYLVIGQVSEWRYKVGVDGEPAVGLALTVLDVGSGQRVYSAVGGKSGFSRESLAGVAQKLVRELLGPLAP